MLESQAWSSWYSETRRYCGIALPLSDDGLTISETGRRFKFMYNIYKMFEPCTQFEGYRTTVYYDTKGYYSLFKSLMGFNMDMEGGMDMEYGYGE